MSRFDLLSGKDYPEGITEAETQVGTLFEHFKTGAKYMLAGWAVNCTNGHEDQRLVLYRRVGQITDQPFARDAFEFFETLNDGRRRVMPVQPN